MIIAEKPRSGSRRRIPLTYRPLDLLYFSFFLVHIPATLLVDTQHLYPTWLFPPFFHSLQRTYLSMSNDPLLGSATGFFGPNVEKPVWFNSFIALEVLFQVPVFFFGARALYKGSRAIYVLLLIYGASTFTTVLPCITTILHTPETTTAAIGQKIISLTFEQRVLLLSSYVPFAVVPLVMTIDMAFRVWSLVKVGIRASDEGKWK